MIVDKIYPTEIVTRHVNEQNLANVDMVKLNLDHTDPRIIDIVLCINVLTGVERGAQVDDGLLLTYSRRLGNIRSFRRLILSTISGAEYLNAEEMMAWRACGFCKSFRASENFILNLSSSRKSIC